MESRIKALIDRFSKENNNRFHQGMAFLTPPKNLNLMSLRNNSNNHRIILSFKHKIYLNNHYINNLSSHNSNIHSNLNIQINKEI